MKKATLFFIGILMGAALIAQPVVDNAIIPVAVNLNSILRLNVTSGGNIEFTVNNIAQYTGGIANSDRYDTKFTVASSVDFDVLMYAESANLVGSDLATNTIPVGNVGYRMESDGSGADNGVPSRYQLVGADANPSIVHDLDANVANEIVSGIANASAGDVSQNSFIINWELATAAVQTAATLNSLLAQSIAPDRYTTNVFLVLQPTP